MSIPKIDEMPIGSPGVADLGRLALTPIMAPDAYHGLAGRIVEAIAPHSESDPVAILMHVLIAGGNVIGRGPHALVEKTAHNTNNFAVLVGLTSKGRKGQAWSIPRWLLGQIDETWMNTRVRSGLSSGEGVIYHVRDAREELQPIKERGKVVDYQRVVVDGGESDKRLLAFEPEFATVLRRMQGEANSLSSVLRDAWDTGNLSTLTKNSPMRATGAHISIIAHITAEELRARLTEIDRVNGFANRFLYALVRRSKCLPEDSPIPEAALTPLIDDLRAVVRDAARPYQLGRDPEAREIWAAVYPRLSEGERGLIGAVLARAEAHVLRLSLVYATFDRSAVIRAEHLRAALAVWDYCELSARRIFGDAIGLSVADTILETLRRRGPMTKTEIVVLFGNNKLTSEIDVALAMLLEMGKVKRTTRSSPSGKGRSAEVWEAVA